MSEPSTGIISREAKPKLRPHAGVVGIGILSLPAGIAAGTGLVTGLLILIAMYVASWLQIEKRFGASKTLEKGEGEAGGV